MAIAGDVVVEACSVVLWVGVSGVGGALVDVGFWVVVIFSVVVNSEVVVNSAAAVVVGKSSRGIILQFQVWQFLARCSVLT